MALSRYKNASKQIAPPARMEFDILKASHKYVNPFIRTHACSLTGVFTAAKFSCEDDKRPDNDLSWDDKLAKKT